MNENELKKINIQNIKECYVENMSNFDLKNIDIGDLEKVLVFLESRIDYYHSKLNHKAKDKIIILYRYILHNYDFDDFSKQHVSRQILDTIDSSISRLEQIAQKRSGETFKAFGAELSLYSNEIKYITDGLEAKE